MKKLWLYVGGILIVYFQMAFLNSFDFYTNFIGIDLTALFLYSIYMTTKFQVIDLIIVLGFISDLLSNSILGIHSLVYFSIFIIVKLVTTKFNLSLFTKYIMVLIFGIIHSILFNLLIGNISIFSYIEFSLILLIIISIINMKKVRSGWFV